MACMQCSDLIPAHVRHSHFSRRYILCRIILSLKGSSLTCADWDTAVCGGGHHDL